MHASSSNTRGLRLLTDGKIETGWSSLGTAFPHWIQIESPPAGRQLLMLTHRHVNGTPSKVRLRARNSKTGTSRVLRDIDLMPELLHYSYRNNAAVVLANSAELQPNETRIVVEINAVHDGSTSQGTRQTSISGFVFASCVSSSGRRDEILPAILGMDIRPAQRTWLEGAVRTITVPAQPPCSPSNVHFSATHREEASVVLKWQAPLHDGGSGITGFKVYVEVFPSVLLQETCTTAASTVSAHNRRENHESSTICRNTGNQITAVSSQMHVCTDGKHLLKLPMPPPLTFYKAQVTTFNQCGDSAPSTQYAQWSRNGVIVVLVPTLPSATTASQESTTPAAAVAPPPPTAPAAAAPAAPAAAQPAAPAATPLETVDIALAALLVDGPVLAGLVRRIPTFCDGIPFAATPAEQAAAKAWSRRAKECNARANQIAVALQGSARTPQKHGTPAVKQVMEDMLSSRVALALKPPRSRILEDNSTQGEHQNATLLHIFAGRGGGGGNADMDGFGTAELHYLLHDCKALTKHIGSSLCSADARGRTPLLVAASVLNLAACTLLVDACKTYLDSDSFRKVVGSTDKLGNTALHYLAAADVGFTEEFKGLVLKIAEHTTLTLENNESENVLVRALKFGQVRLVKFLFCGNDDDDRSFLLGSTRDSITEGLDIVLQCKDSAGNTLLHLASLIAIHLAVQGFGASFQPIDNQSLVFDSDVIQLINWLKVYAASLISAKNNAGWTAPAMVWNWLSSRDDISKDVSMNDCATLEYCFMRDEPSLVACLGVEPRLLNSTVWAMLRNSTKPLKSVCNTFIQNLAPLAETDSATVKPFVKAAARIFSTCFASNLAVNANTMLSVNGATLKRNLQIVFQQFPELSILELGECARAYISPMLKNTVPEVQVPALNLGLSASAAKRGLIDICNDTWDADADACVDQWQHLNDEYLKGTGTQTGFFIGRASERYIVTLIEAGNVTALEEAFNERTMFSEMPPPASFLFAAASQKHAKVAWLLLKTFHVGKSKLNLNATNSQGNTALAIATKEGYAQIVTLLLQQDGLDPDATARLDGATPLHLACPNRDNFRLGDHSTKLPACYNAEAMVHLLLQGGCNPSACNVNGKRAVDLAEEHNLPACAELLRRWPASSSLASSSSSGARARLHKDANRILKIEPKPRDKESDLAGAVGAVVEHRPRCESKRHIFTRTWIKMDLSRTITVSNNDGRASQPSPPPRSPSSFTCSKCYVTRKWHPNARPPQRWRCGSCGDQICIQCCAPRSNFGTWSRTLKQKPASTSTSTSTVLLATKLAITTSRLLKEQVALLGICRERATKPMRWHTPGHEIFLSVNEDVWRYVREEMDYLECELDEGQMYDADKDTMSSSTLSDMYMASLLDRHGGVDCNAPFVDLSGYSTIAILADALLHALPCLQLEPAPIPSMPSASPLLQQSSPAIELAASGGLSPGESEAVVKLAQPSGQVESPFFLRDNSATDVPDDYTDGADDIDISSLLAKGTMVRFDVSVDAALPLANNPHLLTTDRSVMFGAGGTVSSSRDSGGGSITSSTHVAALLRPAKVRSCSYLSPARRSSFGAAVSSRPTAPTRMTLSAETRRFIIDDDDTDDESKHQPFGIEDAISAEASWPFEAFKDGIPLQTVFHHRWGTSIRMLSTEFMGYFAHGESVGYFKHVLRDSLSAEMKDGLFTSIIEGHAMFNKHRAYFVGPKEIERDNIVTSSAERIDQEVAKSCFPFRLDRAEFTQEQGSGPGVTRGWWTAVADALSAPSAVFVSSLAQSAHTVTLLGGAVAGNDVSESESDGSMHGLADDSINDTISGTASMLELAGASGGISGTAGVPGFYLDGTSSDSADDGMSAGANMPGMPGLAGASETEDDDDSMPELAGDSESEDASSSDDSDDDNGVVASDTEMDLVAGDDAITGDQSREALASPSAATRCCRIRLPGFPLLPSINPVKVVWIGKVPKSSEESVTFVSVDPKVGGLCVLSNGARFANPANMLSLVCPVQYAGIDRGDSGGDSFNGAGGSRGSEQQDQDQDQLSAPSEAVAPPALLISRTPPLRWIAAGPGIRIAAGGLGVASDSQPLSGALSNVGFDSGIHEFEATIRGQDSGLQAMFGIATPGVSLYDMSSLEQEGTWVWHLGGRFAAAGRMRTTHAVPAVPNNGDKVSCIINLNQGTVSFRVNRSTVFRAVTDLPFGQGQVYCPFVKLGNTNALTGLRLVSSTTPPVIAPVVSAASLHAARSVRNVAAARDGDGAGASGAGGAGGAGADGGRNEAGLPMASIRYRQLFFEPGHSGVFSPCYIPAEDQQWLGGQLAARYRFVGRFVGLALFNRTRLGFRLSRHVVKFILRLPLHWNDVAFYSTSTFEKFRQMIDNPEKWVPPGLLDFTLDLRERAGLSGFPPAELKPGGASIEVTPANVAEYVELSARMMLETSTLRALVELRTGFEEVFAAGTFDLFTAEDFAIYLNGSPTIDVAVLKAHTRVRGGSSRFQTLFWDVLDKRFTSADRSRLLSFWTGSATVPSNLSGFHLNLTVQTGSGIHAHSSRLPSASTCSSQMSMPEYADAATLERRLRTALHELSYQLN